ncbi:MAG: hypothetical protein R2713_07150 [Ilumatobacteraceae bacterium]
MILGGDELARTQEGNNNAYRQDNELSWFDWSSIDTEQSFTKVHDNVAATCASHLPATTVLPGPAAARQRGDPGTPGTPARASRMKDEQDDGELVRSRSSSVAQLHRDGRPGEQVHDDDFLWFVNPRPTRAGFEIPGDHGDVDRGDRHGGGVVEPSEPIVLDGG